MNEPKRYFQVIDGEMSGIDHVKAFAKGVLAEEGFDISKINIKEEGITIAAFNKLVKTVFDLGYREGLQKRALLADENKRLEREASAISNFGSLAASTLRENLGNKKFRAY